jgi:glycosyltransferase involved in cell wall biosynthesis
MTPPKIAIFYDWLNQWGGAERLLLDLLSVFPQADLFTAFYKPSLCPWLPKDILVYSTPLSHLPLWLTKLPLVHTLIPPLIEGFNFNDYQIIISLTSQSGHCLITPPKSLFLCYCLTPNRYLYNSSVNPLLKRYRSLDFIFSRRPDKYLSISDTVSIRIKQAYNRPSLIIRPGINTDFFTLPKTTKKSSFLIVSRLVEHKNIELAIKAAIFAKVDLNIIGTGRYEDSLKQIASGHSNINFLGSVSEASLRDFYQNSLALICPQVEDFGLAPLESLACGTPVIALNRGGISENITPNSGILFDVPDPSVLAQVLIDFDPTKYLSKDCRVQALNFSRANFMLKFQNQVLKLWLHHQKTNDY